MDDVRQTQILTPHYAYRCSHCGRIIVKQAELKGRLWMRNERPIHSLCLLLHYPKSGKLDYRRITGMRSERERYARDVKQSAQIANRKERQKVIDIAAESQNIGDAPSNTIPQRGRD